MSANEKVGYPPDDAITWLLRLIGESDGQPPEDDWNMETKVKSSGFDDFRLSSEGEALLMHGPHQCAPTYSPNTGWPGLVAYRGISLCSNSSLSGIDSSTDSTAENDKTTTRAAKVDERSKSQNLM